MKTMVRGKSMARRDVCQSREECKVSCIVMFPGLAWAYIYHIWMNRWGITFPKSAHDKSNTARNKPVDFGSYRQYPPPYRLWVLEGDR